MSGMLVAQQLRLREGNLPFSIITSMAEGKVGRIRVVIFLMNATSKKILMLGMPVQQRIRLREENLLFGIIWSMVEGKVGRIPPPRFLGLPRDQRVLLKSVEIP